MSMPADMTKNPWCGCLRDHPRRSMNLAVSDFNSANRVQHMPA